FDDKTGVSQVTVRATDGEFVVSQMFRVDVVDTRIFFDIRTGAYDNAVFNATGQTQFVIPTFITLDNRTLVANQTSSVVEGVVTFDNVVADTRFDIVYEPEGFTHKTIPFFVDSRITDCGLHDCSMTRQDVVTECTVQDTVLHCEVTIDGVQTRYAYMGSQQGQHTISLLVGVDKISVPIIEPPVVVFMPRDHIHISSFRIERGLYPDELLAYVSLTNKGPRTQSGVKATFMIPELDAYGSFGPISVGRDQTITRIVPLYTHRDVHPGYYIARMVVYAENVNRVKFREVIIE
ncbi:MAG: hypothetical protein ACMXYC_02550, partial [Candidatus Woesearchaeota archaeon]